MIKKITQKRLYNIAVYYLSRYESSTGKLRQILQRRILKAQINGQEIPAEADTWIEDIIQEMVRLGYLDNQRFMQNTFQRLCEGGKSLYTIQNKLRQAGIDAEQIQNLLDKESLSRDDLDLNAARRLVKKRKMGHWRLPDSQEQMYQKDLAALGRAGFSYEIAQQALKASDD